MGRILIGFLFTLTIAVSGVALPAGTFSRNEFLSIKEAEKKWGKAQFDTKKFKEGNEAQKASMSVSLILSKRFIGKPLKSVRDELGSPDGYFENDAIPAYILTPDSKDKKTDVWQLIFLPDKDWKKIDEVKIHKNCCS
jgi:hypothetical protein